jgi:hypothetical protein
MEQEAVNTDLALLRPPLEEAINTDLKKQLSGMKALCLLQTELRTVTACRGVNSCMEYSKQGRMHESV